jgi:hypothetical protein
MLSSSWRSDQIINVQSPLAGYTSSRRYSSLPEYVEALGALKLHLILCDHDCDSEVETNTRPVSPRP